MASIHIRGGLQQKSVYLLPQSGTRLLLIYIPITTLCNFTLLVSDRGVEDGCYSESFAWYFLNVFMSLCIS